MFGQNTREIGWLVEAGIAPAEIVRIATLNGAELLGVSDRLGRLQPGYLADVVAVEGSPLSNPGVLIDSMKWVMQNGRVVVDATAH